MKEPIIIESPRSKWIPLFIEREKEEGTHIESLNTEELINRLINDAGIRRIHKDRVERKEEKILNQHGVINYNWYVRRAKKELIKRIIKK